MLFAEQVDDSDADPLLSLDSRTATCSLAFSRSSMRSPKVQVMLLSSWTAPMFSEEKKESFFSVWL